MESAGLWMLLAVAIDAARDRPAGLDRADRRVGGLRGDRRAGIGAFDYDLLTALPIRLVGLLENDLLQALPLYALMGVLLNRLPLAESGCAPRRRRSARTASAQRALGARPRRPAGADERLGRRQRRHARAQRCAPSSRRAAAASRGDGAGLRRQHLGVVVPPSLVLVLLGDAMMRAHTEAVNATRQMVRIVNTQDIFRGALVPAGMFLACSGSSPWWSARPPQAAAAAAKRRPRRNG